jgi:hypothetical protein
MHVLIREYNDGKLEVVSDAGIIIAAEEAHTNRSILLFPVSSLTITMTIFLNGLKSSYVRKMISRNRRFCLTYL